MSLSKSEEIIIPELDVKSALELLKQDPNVLLLDVRRPEEYADGSIEGSVHLELAELLDGKLASLLSYKDTGIILQCRGGHRSMRAAEYLATQGFTKLWNLAGGILAYWELSSEDAD